ncbi:MAG: histidinol-phosphate phosphatase family protein [Gammaproteobacteria bacterium]|nr:histidinol-phosphate phosphatase family protein [Gammaproteobacteria bacterium]
MKLIILDRDGVINHDSKHYIKSPEEWMPIPGSLAALAKLTQAGWTIAIATNQSGIARGLYTHEILAAIHAKMQSMVAAAGGQIDSIFYCPHHPAEHCHCRKPQPGLVEQIAAHYAVDMVGIPFVGDKWTDVETALAGGCQPILVETGLIKTQIFPTEQAVPVFANLLQAVNKLVS